MQRRMRGGPRARTRRPWGRTLLRLATAWTLGCAGAPVALVPPAPMATAAGEAVVPPAPIASARAVAPAGGTTAHGARAVGAVLPDGASEAPPILIRGATVWTATGLVLDASDILVRDGRIAAVGKSLEAPAGARILQAEGRVVTPGLVDLHSHLGVYAMPSTAAHNDGNEMVQPLTPMVRAIDALDPEDPAIARALSGGVTTALILPGSGNVMGGTGVVIKLRGATVTDMVVPDAPMQLKMAMGENPKRAHGSKGRLPSTRMGHAWLLRDRFAAARDALRKRAEATAAGKPAPDVDRSLWPLMELIEGRARLHVHCYEVHDIETLLRVTAEAGVRVTAIHHALEAWKVPTPLRERGVGVATFADLWGFKMEAYDASVRGPAILAKAGVAVALKSDHPVMDARELMGEAAKAHHYGLDAQAALAAVTRVPATLMGMAERIGTVEVGKEADLLIWDAPPLTTLGARPTHVLVDGVLWIEGGRNHQAAHAGPPRPDVGSPCGCGL